MQKCKSFFEKSWSFVIVLIISVLAIRPAYSIYFGPRIGYLNQSKSYENIKLINEKGVLYGFSAGLCPTFMYLFFVDVNCDYLKGSTKLDGLKIDNTLIDSDGKVGLNFKLKKINFKPYIGFGYNYHKKEYFDHLTYLNWYYLELGANLKFQINSYWEVGLNGILKQSQDSKIKLSQISEIHKKIDLSKKMNLEINLNNYINLYIMNLCITFFYIENDIENIDKTNLINFYQEYGKQKIFGGQATLGYNF